MNPLPIEIPHETIIKIGSALTFLDIQKLEGGKTYYRTYRDFGEDAPTLPSDPSNPRVDPSSEWTIMRDYITTFKSNAASDIYIYCTSGDKNKNGWLNTGVFTDYDTGLAGGFSESFELACSKGLIPGHSKVDKFGENPDIDTGTVPEDIWEFGGEYNYDPVGTAPIVSLVSDDPLDTQVIEVTGQDINRNEVVQQITLTGTTRVPLTTPLWRVYRMANLADAGGEINGVVYCYTGLTNTPLASEVRAIIDDGNNQTLMALYTVPLGKVGFLYRGELGSSRSVSAGQSQCAYYSRRLGKVFRIKKRVDLANSGSSIYVDKRSFPDIIPSGTDIKLRVENVSANNTGVFGTFDLLLVDEDLFSDEYLSGIGQPGY